MTAVLDRNPQVDLNGAVDEMRCYYDLRYLYQRVLCHGNRAYQQALGRIHDFMCDFYRLDELALLDDHCVHSPIRDYLPPREEGTWSERWMYWPTLDAEPQIEEGDCALAKDFADGRLLTEQRGGLLLRVVGDGDMLYLLVPRGHLKTSLGTYGCSIQDIIRDKTYRIVIRSGEEELPAKVLGLVKHTFMHNPVFREYWGDLTPDRHTALWNKSQMQVSSDARRGADPTLSAFGIGTNITGAHGDKAVFDDIVTLQNLNQQPKVMDKVSEVAFVVDRGFKVLGQGTLYADDDAHSAWIRPGAGAYPFVSFMVASLLDARGNPLWDYYTPRLIAKKKAITLTKGRGMGFWYSQMWNNPFIADDEGFKDEWLENEYSGSAEDAVRKYELNVVIACDPGTGKSESAGWATAMVKGQDSDGKRYILDGFYEKLSPDELPVAIVGLCEHWDKISRKNGQGSIRLGLEENNTKTWLGRAVRNEMRRRGLAWSIEFLKHGNKPKNVRIRTLGPVYSSRSVLWPEGEMMRYAGQWHGEVGEPYDFKDKHRNEYRKWPAIHAEILDSEAYTEQMVRPDRMNVHDETTENKRRSDPSVYTRTTEDERSEGEFGKYYPQGLRAANRAVRRSGGQLGIGRAIAEDDEW